MATEPWIARALRKETWVSIAKGPWAKLFALWVITVGAPDLLWRWDVLTPRYLLAMAGSVALWAIVVAVVARLRPVSRPLAIVVALLFALVITLSMGGAHGYHRFFRKDMRSLEWEFALENPVFSLKLVTTAMTRMDRFLLSLELLVLSAGVLRLSRDPEVAASRLLPWRAVPLFLGAAVITFLAWSLSGDLVFLRAVTMGTYAHERRGGHPQTLPLPERVALPSGRARHTPNVLLVINESLGAAQALKEGGAAQKMAAFLKAHADHAVSFPHAETVATATCVSIPTILTGLHSCASRDDFAHAPVMWNDARSLGYKTGLFSAQEYQFEFFDQFFLGKDAPDEVRTAGDYVSHAERVNELGVDEAQVVDDAIHFVEKAPADRPFFMVVQFNSTHWPCWSPTLAAVHWTGTMSVGLDSKRCSAATRYVDEQTARLFDALDRQGRLESTLIVFTSDHGEVFRQGRPLRRYSFYEDVLAIPFAVHLPAEMAGEVGALRSNEERRVSNEDIYPTLLDAWGRWPIDASSGRPPLPGQSLLRPVSKDRVLISVTDSEISRETRAFALFHGRWKWIVTEQAGVQLFDLDADPDELHDRAAEAPPDEKRIFLEEVKKYPSVQKILDDMGTPRPKGAAKAEP